MRLSQFKDFLKRKKILTQFELSRIGYAEPGFESAVKKADLVISVYKETTELIQKILGKNAGQKIVECEKYGGNLFKDESEKMWPEILQKITQKK